jgi:hypothetical protein
MLTNLDHCCRDAQFAERPFVGFDDVSGGQAWRRGAENDAH